MPQPHWWSHLRGKRRAGLGIMFTHSGFILDVLGSQVLSVVKAVFMLRWKDLGSFQTRDIFTSLYG